MDKDKKEKELLYQWACKYYTDKLKEKIFFPIDIDVNTYFQKREKEGCYLHEYAFQELPELRNQLNEMWGTDEYMSEIVRTVLVGAFKNRIEINGDSKGKDTEQFAVLDELPPYIYGF